jgi:hypothetical protein
MVSSCLLVAPAALAAEKLPAGAVRAWPQNCARVWAAAVRSLECYSITRASREKGELTTEWIPFAHHLDCGDPEGAEDRQMQATWHSARSRLNLDLVPEGPSCRIEIRKDLRRYDPVRGLFVLAPSDGREELRLLSRVDGELATVPEEGKK